MTPAQAFGHPDFVTDVPVQGPTDPGIRAADCRYAQTVLPAQPACADCKGPIPMWTQQALSTVRGSSAGVGEQIAFGGRRAHGFALGGPGDPNIWATLSPAQQTWVAATYSMWNALVVTDSGTSCPTWPASPTGTAADITAMSGCFQNWWNTNYPPSGAKTLRTDGALDEDTLCALITATVSLHPDKFQPFPDPNKQHCQTATTPKKGLSTAAMVGIGAAGLAVAGVGYAVMRKGGKGRRRRR